MAFNVALLIVTIIVTIAIFFVNVYVLVNYQHPDDNNQAYFPKFIVVLGLSIAQLSILMLPADVANRTACKYALIGTCKQTLPMKDLWYAVYVIDAVLVFLIIPFSMYFYEADQEKSIGQRIVSAMMWSGMTAVIAGLVLGILYGVVGYADFPIRRLVAYTKPASNMLADLKLLTEKSPCIKGEGSKALDTVGVLCSGKLAADFRVNYGYLSKTSWSVRVSFPMYVIALYTIAGSIFFSVFGGVGIVSLPLDCILAFIRRPRAVITRSQYIKEATELGNRAKDIRETALALQREERSGNKSRGWKKNYRELEKALLELEDDRQSLEEMYPQGEQADTAWAVTVLSYLGKFIFGILGLIITIAWLIHIVINMLIYPPASPFLNQIFIKLDSAWGLLGTAAFAFFCFYLLLATIAGEMKMGFNLGFFAVHPMKWNGTMMSSFLFNVALVLLSTSSVIQFCQQAFAKYAQDTAVQQIFGQQLTALRGIKYLFIFNVFQIAFIICALLSIIFSLSFGVKKQKKRKLTITK